MTQADSDAEQEPQKLLGPWSTAFTLFKGFVGTGILYMPTAFISGGSVFSAVALLGTLLVTLFCIKLLLQVRSTLGSHLSFSDLGVATCGRAGKLTVDVTLFLSQTSFVVAQIYFISSQTLHMINASRVMQGLQPVSEQFKWLFLPLCFVMLMPMLMVHK